MGSTYGQHRLLAAMERELDDGHGMLRKRQGT